MGYLVSVIVPVYNVEEYLRDCIDRVCMQTYRNIEIILVDDGSTDNSGQICEAYASQDNRIKVIHKMNGGLSSARNAGIEASSGDILAFVDSDDYPDINMIEVMLPFFDGNKSDIVCCDYTWKEEELGMGEGINVMSAPHAISEYLNDTGYRTFAWNKLYRKELFSDVKFPEGELYEDIKTIYSLFKKSEIVTYVRQKLYYYRTRSGSITNTFSEKHRDVIRAINHVYKDSKTVEGIDYRSFNSGYISHYVRFIKKGILADVDMSRELKYIKRIIRKSIYSIISNKGLYTKNKLGMLLLAVSPAAFKRVFVKTR